MVVSLGRYDALTTAELGTGEGFLFLPFILYTIKTISKVNELEIINVIANVIPTAAAVFSPSLSSSSSSSSSSSTTTSLGA